MPVPVPSLAQELPHAASAVKKKKKKKRKKNSPSYSRCPTFLVLFLEATMVISFLFILSETFLSSHKEICKFIFVSFLPPLPSFLFTNGNILELLLFFTWFIWEIVSYQHIKGKLIFSWLQSSPLYGRTITFNHFPIDRQWYYFQSYAVNAAAKKYCIGVPVVAQWLMNPTRNHEDAGSIPGLAQWVKNRHRRELWCRLQMWLRSRAAVALA